MIGLREFLIRLVTGKPAPDPTPDPEPTAVCTFCKQEKPISEMTPTIWRGAGLDAEELAAPTCDDCCANHCRFNHEHGDWELLPGHHLPAETEVLSLGQA